MTFTYMKHERMLQVVRCLLSLAWVDLCIYISFDKTDALCIACMHKLIKATRSSLPQTQILQLAFSTAPFWQVEVQRQMFVVLF